MAPQARPDLQSHGQSNLLRFFCVALSCSCRRSTIGVQEVSAAEQRRLVEVATDGDRLPRCSSRHPARAPGSPPRIRCTLEIVDLHRTKVALRARPFSTATSTASPGLARAAAAGEPAPAAVVRVGRRLHAFVMAANASSLERFAEAPAGRAVDGSVARLENAGAAGLAAAHQLERRSAADRARRAGAAGGGAARAVEIAGHRARTAVARCGPVRIRRTYISATAAVLGVSQEVDALARSAAAYASLAPGESTRFIRVGPVASRE
jgi:hypothetical protein